MNKEELKVQMKALELRIPYDVALHESRKLYEQILTDLLNDTKFICLSLLFPFEDYTDYVMPKQYYNWQLRACVEMYNLADKIYIKDYSENGISWSRMKDGLSQSLMQEITSWIGTVDNERE